MKWNILVGSLVLGLGLSTQSFGMDLLDRMLGMNYNGGCDKASCCETSCCDPGPSCGCETGCDACAPAQRNVARLPCWTSCEDVAARKRIAASRLAVAKPPVIPVAAAKSLVIPVVVSNQLVVAKTPAPASAARPRSAVARCWIS